MFLKLQMTVYMENTKYRLKYVESKENLKKKYLLSDG